MAAIIHRSRGYPPSKGIGRKRLKKMPLLVLLLLAVIVSWTYISIERREVISGGVELLKDDSTAAATLRGGGGQILNQSQSRADPPEDAGGAVPTVIPLKDDSTAATPRRRGQIPNQGRAGPPEDTDTIISPSAECKLYLAESTIPNAGLGLYTGVPVAKGTKLGGGDIAIPVIDLDFHNAGYHNKIDLTKNYHFPWSEYMWKAAFTGVDMQSEAENTDVVVPGFGSAINCHLGLINVAEGTPKYNSSILHRSRDPGAGAITNYRDRPSTATKDIPSGAELFVDYGRSWFETRTDVLGMIPLETDYGKAERFMLKYEKFLKENGNDLMSGGNNNDMEEDLWEMMKGFDEASRGLNALPASAEAARDVIEGGKGIKHALIETSVRSPEWLRRNGKCLDNIRPGRSTTAQAGWGAFATRPIPRGGLVAPAPLIHIADGRKVMKMYAKKKHSKDGRTKLERDNSTLVGHQLLLNYCFGHEESTMLLCPYGGLETLINHNGRAPNAKIQWADSSTVGHSADWLNRSVAELGKLWNAGLQLEFVATADIAPGEEVFVNYGTLWEEAWDLHVRTWKAPPRSTDYVRAFELNAEYAGRPLKTTKELEGGSPDTRPGNVEVGCHFNVANRQHRINVTKYGDSETVYRRKYIPSDLRNDIYPCELLNRSEDGMLYEARILRRTAALSITKEGRFPTLPEGEMYILTNIPRRAIAFVDRLYSGDNHLPKAFRHEIMIPDDVFPLKWKNRLK